MAPTAKLRHPSREWRFKTASHINCRQRLAFALVVLLEFCAFKSQFRLFGVGLRVHGYILACGHGHPSGDQACDPCDQDTTVSSMRRRNAEH